MEKVKELVKEIKSGLTQISASKKDEVKVMKAMLNDKDFKVTVSEGTEEFQYCIADDARKMVGNIISSAAKIPQAEASKLAQNYEFSKSDAVTLVDVSKEFVTTYLQTGRKLPLGQSVSNSISLSEKEVPASIRSYPKKIGVNTDGTGRYEKSKVEVKAYNSVRVHVPPSKFK